MVLIIIGYGFVDFEHPVSAENAVKSLISQGVQAQMAKCTDTNRAKGTLSKAGSIVNYVPSFNYLVMTLVFVSFFLE